MKAVGDGGVDDGSVGAGLEVGVRGWCSGAQGQLIKLADDAAPGVWRGRNLTSGNFTVRSPPGESLQQEDGRAGWAVSVEKKSGMVVVGRWDDE